MTTLHSAITQHEIDEVEKKSRKQQEFKAKMDRYAINIVKECQNKIFGLDFKKISQQLVKNAKKGKKFAKLFDIDEDGGFFFNRKWSNLRENSLDNILNELNCLGAVKNGFKSINFEIENVKVSTLRQCVYLPSGSIEPFEAYFYYRVYVEWT